MNSNWSLLDHAQKALMVQAIVMVQHCQEATHVPASITVAQWAIESAWGTSKLAEVAHNYFGIKAESGWEGAVFEVFTKEQLATGAWETIFAKFRKYPNQFQGFNDHSVFLKKGRYDICFQYPPGTKPEEKHVWFAMHLQSAGYATDHHYANMLIETIERYGWQYYDK